MPWPANTGSSYAIHLGYRLKSGFTVFLLAIYSEESKNKSVGVPWAWDFWAVKIKSSAQKQCRKLTACQLLVLVFHPKSEVGDSGNRLPFMSVKRVLVNLLSEIIAFRCFSQQFPETFYPCQPWVGRMPLDNQHFVTITRQMSIPLVVQSCRMETLGHRGNKKTDELYPFPWSSLLYPQVVL